MSCVFVPDAWASTIRRVAETPGLPASWICGLLQGSAGRPLSQWAGAVPGEHAVAEIGVLAAMFIRYGNYRLDRDVRAALVETAHQCKRADFLAKLCRDVEVGDARDLFRLAAQIDPRAVLPCSWIPHSHIARGSSSPTCYRCSSPMTVKSGCEPWPRSRRCRSRASRRSPAHYRTISCLPTFRSRRDPSNGRSPASANSPPSRKAGGNEHTVRRPCRCAVATPDPQEIHRAECEPPLGPHPASLRFCRWSAGHSVLRSNEKRPPHSPESGQPGRMTRFSTTSVQRNTPMRTLERNLSDTARLRLGILTAHAWEALVQVHRAAATRFVRAMAGHLKLEAALDRYLRELQLDGALASAVRRRALLDLAAGQEADGTEVVHPFLRGRACLNLRHAMRQLRGWRRRRSENDLCVRMLVAEAETAVIELHARFAAETANALATELPLLAAVRLYLKQLGIRETEAADVGRRALVSLLADYWPRPDERPSAPLAVARTEQGEMSKAVPPRATLLQTA